MFIKCTKMESQSKNLKNVVSKINSRVAIGAEKKVLTQPETPAATANATIILLNQAIKHTTTSNNQANNTFSPTTTSAQNLRKLQLLKHPSGVNFVTPGPTSAAFTNLVDRGYLKQWTYPYSSFG